MKNILLLTFLIFIFLIVGCDKQPEKPLCQGVYFEYKTGECCLDANNNQICDEDEKEGKEDIKKEAVEIETPETVARKLAQTWEAEEYEEMYDFFVPELKQLKSKEEFVYFLEETKMEDETKSIRLDEVYLVNDTTALAPK